MKKICTKEKKLSNQDIKAFEHYCLGTPKEWTQNAAKGMINKAIQNIINDYLPIYKESHESIPVDLAELIPSLIGLSQFKPYKQKWENLIKPERKEQNSVNTEIWTNGFDIEDYEEAALNAYWDDYEQILDDLVENKMACRKNAFEEETRKKAEFPSLPSKQDDLIDFITSQSGYKNREQNENA